jgi:V/A-type H+-transporting ATPase subunit F
MQILVIGDEDTVTGFRMAGVQGTIVRNEQEAHEAIREAAGHREAVIIVQQRTAEMVREEIDDIRYGTDLPLIVEVPGIEGPSEQGPSLFRLIRETVGIEFET